MFTMNYKFSSLKNSNLWFKLQLGIGMIFFLGMCAAVSGLAERNTHILMEKVGPALRVSLCHSVEVHQHCSAEPTFTGALSRLVA